MSDDRDPFRDASSAVQVKEIADRLHSEAAKKAKKEAEEKRDQDKLIKSSESSTHLLTKMNKSSNVMLIVTILSIAVPFAVAIISLVARR